MSKDSKRKPVENKRPLKNIKKRVYKRNDQGTLAYAPDIAVFILTDEYGIIDVGPDITNWTLSRNVNQPSSFSCSIDNKWSRYDRVIRRMNRITVFLKRLNWMQVFSGYITVAPWQTITPGEITITADCTMKRLVHSYWDPYSQEAVNLLPTVVGDAMAGTKIDGGAAYAMFKILTDVVQWNPSQIHIQNIPGDWVTRAAQIAAKQKREDDTDNDYQTIKSELQKLIDANGWAGVSGLPGGNGGGGPGASGGSGDDNPSNLAGGLALSGVDKSWQKKYGKPPKQTFPPDYSPKIEHYSGRDIYKYLQSAGFSDYEGFDIRLRKDAAASLMDLSAHFASTGGGPRGRGGIPVQRAYVSYDDQVKKIKEKMAAEKSAGKGSSYYNQSTVCADWPPCPAGASDHGWGTAIDLMGEGATWANKNPNEMAKFGWFRGDEHLNHWVFKGAWPKYPAYYSSKPKTMEDGKPLPIPANQYGATSEDDSTGKESVFNTMWQFPTAEAQSYVYTGKRAWINDVSVLPTIQQVSAASLRDFMSAPNGDFIAFFPDRLGIYGRWPTMSIRNIEVVDFKLAVSDVNMVTHYFTSGELFQAEGTVSAGVNYNDFWLSAMVTVEQEDIIKMLLGEKPDADLGNLGEWALNRFGLRPRVERGGSVIKNPGFLFTIALHKFQEAWANQWQALVGFTFMPEIMPGMRIELADYNIGVYVESVVHSGSRTGGFSTDVTVSTPMKKHSDGKWYMLPMEFDPADFKTTRFREEELTREEKLAQDPNPWGHGR